MPESAVADAEVDVEPADKRTNAHKAWLARHPVAPPEAPPAMPIPPAAEPASATPASVVDAIKTRRLLTPDEFIALNSDPGAVTQFSGHTNAAAGYANAMTIAYTSYLLMRSPGFSAWYKAEMAEGRVQKQILPDPTYVDRLYDVAAGK